ncbi:MAG: thioredoxin domain-containing protein [Myxococcota bacterium]
MTVRDPTNPASGEPSPQRLALLVGLGALAALWALFQWGELLVARAGGESFCAINATFDCAAVWDSPFASAVHSTTGLPVAGWGLAWGLVALLLPLWALVHRASGLPVAIGWLGTLWVAAAGVVAVLVMAVASLASGHLCITCLATYAIVLAYGAVSLPSFHLGATGGARTALVTALTCTLAVYLVLLWPGLRTPRARERAHISTPTATDSMRPTHQGPADTVLAGFIGQLSPAARQALSDAIAAMKASPDVPMRAPRVLLGSPTAAVRITDFTDVLCGHCAALHESLDELRRAVPPDALAIESRQFPLDGACNSYLSSPPAHPVRCLAARAQICLEQSPRAFEFSAALFAAQQQLTEDKVYALATPYLPRAALDACMRSPETEAKLRDDLAWAMAFGIDGTPLVLINGREAAPFAPLLYAMALTGGDVHHPLFAGLPPPRLARTMH